MVFEQPHPGTPDALGRSTPTLLNENSRYARVSLRSPYFSPALDDGFPPVRLNPLNF